MNKRPDHFFVSDEGTLHDTRDPDWSRKPLRDNYARGHVHIRSLADVKACLRHGDYAWPGGYPLYFVTSDGGALAFDTVRAEFESIVWAHMNDERLGGWHLYGVDVNYEDNDLYDDHTGEKIGCVYDGS